MTQGKWELDKSVRDPMTVAFGFGRRYGFTTLFATALPNEKV